MTSNDDDSLSRRQVLQGLTGGGLSLGFVTAAGARANTGQFGNDGGPGGNGGGPGKGRGSGKQIRGHIVGTRSKGARDEAKREANAVHRVLNFGDIGGAVAGNFPQEALKGLQNRPDVRYIEEDGQVQAIGETLPWGIDRVDADVAHDDGQLGDGADIAILDTGIDSDHPDLVDNIGAGKAYVECGNSVDGSDCTGSNDNTCHEPWDDDENHGTHCAGIADAVDNSEGVVGVSSSATLHAVKVLECSGAGYYSDIAAGLEYTADQGWDVASMSIGASTDSSTLSDACQYASENGVLLVAAAGNEGSCSDCVQYPAKYETVIAVSGTDENDNLADFSSTGPEIELAAPGESILSTVHGGLAYASGTSMACPHVSGAGGLVMAEGDTNSEARTVLEDSAEDIGLSSSEQGKGLLDAEAALESGVDLPSVDTTEAGDASFSGSSGEYTIAAAGSDVWASDDEYGALYHGDVEGDIVARVTIESQENTDPWAKSGIMIANDVTAAGSSAGDVIVAATPENGFAFQWDQEGDGFVDNHVDAGTVSYPCELRLTKAGSEFTGEYSTDGGSNWTRIHTAKIDDADPSQDVGIFTTSHNSGTKCTTEFANFQTEELLVDLPSVDTTDAGNASFSGKTGDYTISAAGSDVWSSADEYGALYYDDVGGDVVARVTIESQENTDPWAKSGIMIANDVTAAGSSAGDVIVAATPENGFAFQWDQNGDGFISNHTGAGAASYPCELRLKKAGTEFTGEYSTDGGSTWTTIDTATIDDANASQDVGIFTTSHNSGTKCTTEFANFQTEALIDLPSVDTTESGDASFSGRSGDYTVEAAGSDVWASDDEYGALYHDDVDGDVVARVTVESQENTHQWAKSGLMVANDITAAGSSVGDVIVAATPGNGFAFQWDHDGDGFVSNHSESGAVSYPCELRLTKAGSEFTGEYSTDGGSTWTTIDTVTIDDANASQDVGIFTTSHNSGTKCTTEFANFSRG